MKDQNYDPLDCIPSVAVIEQRLKDAESKARKLRVLLTTARKIEREAVAHNGEAARHA